MSSEKAYILKMVESGKISVDDAVKLIGALKPNDDENVSFWESIELEEKLNRFASSTESFARDIGSKMNETWKDVEPKFKAAAKVTVEKTVSAIDKLSSVLRDSLKNFEDNKCDCPKNYDSDSPSEENIPEDNEPREN